MILMHESTLDLADQMSWFQRASYLHLERRLPLCRATEPRSGMPSAGLLSPAEARTLHWPR